MKINPVLLALSLLPIAGTATAATALIDFGTNNTPTYNSVVGSAVNVPLNDTTTAPTGWTASVVNTGTGNMGNAGAGANVSAFPAALSSFETTALQDSIFANQGGGAIQAPSMTLSFAGLNAAATYDILLYGSRANAQGVDQIWSLTQGSGGADVTHFSELNDAVFVDWTSISPNGAGVIQVTLSTGADNIGALALNFGSITEVIPEPSAALLAALGALSLLARRRR